MINVTKTFLPPIEEYNLQIKKIWDTRWITNRGALVVELEEKLQTYLNVNNILITNNGTLPIQIALKLLSNSGQIITTPFSYVATTAAIIWENCTPVFVDIDPEYFTIDETKIEASITNKTTTILATHVFGNPCHVDRISEIAEKYNLKVIYDAAHCFGVNYMGESLFNFGDVSTCSFHGTKLFHTGEGGAIFCKNEELRHKIFYSHNFGHNGQLEFFGLGINGKISELQAAMGLAVFPYLQKIIQDRKSIVDYYDNNLNFTKVRKMKIRAQTDWNYSYYPIIFKDEKELLIAVKKLNGRNIFPRRYFYPSLNTLAFVDQINMPISESISSRVLCLPIYSGLDISDLNEICNLINRAW